ncbi:unnamed protein product [Dovyalis caffra]|uniref:S-protein homolog n=1 Tax=Dovyalis caffra TaxID=77055 RepID=A0AAV1S989_9ROSI|nr:unnamed protein product [Dovyalis caffra]
MSRTSTRFLLSVLAIASCMLSRMAHADDYDDPDPYDVYITNNLKGHLFLNCRSKDEVVSKYNLNVNERFSWRFRLNYSSPTVYFCYFLYKTKAKTFDVFDDKKEGGWSAKTRKVYWSLREDGFYFSNNDVDYEKKQPW